MKKIIIGIVLGLMLALVVHQLTGNCNHSADLEIYAYDNIYYVEGLRVTNESNNEDYTFKDKESLKRYIAEVTSRLPEGEKVYIKNN